MKHAFFVTGTDTDVGKTVATAVLAKHLQKQGLSVGVMKPVQCAGDDAQFLKKALSLNDSLEDINPFFAPEPFSPHLAFTRAQVRFQKETVLKVFARFQEKYDVVLVEGAGGLLVPIEHHYLMMDLMCDLNIPVIVISRPGLGTINHTLLTLAQIRERGLEVRGVIFNHTKNGSSGTVEETNPQSIEQFGKTKIIGTIPFFPSFENLEADLDLTCLTVSSQRSKELQQWDKDYVWHPFTQMQDWLKEDPLVIDQAKGNYLIDTDGNHYLDGVSSLWVNVHGHGHPAINRAIKDQVNRMSHSTLLGLAHTPSIELAKKLVALTPQDLNKVFYSDNGSTAVEVGIKMAYQYWQNTGKINKTHIVHLEHSYHGDTLGSVSVGGIDLFHKVYRKLMFETIQIGFPKNTDELEALFKEKNETIAALVVEPLVQGAAGMLMWPDGVLTKMRALCQKYDVLLIADEVATGFGRTGKMFACEQEGICPDMLCLAKGMTGGYLPLAATLTTQRIYDGFLYPYKDQKTFFHGHTYTGNPLACAAALASLEVFENEGVMDQLQPKIKHLSKSLEMFYNLDSVGDVRQRGFMVGIELVADRTTQEPYPWEQQIGARVCHAIRSSGVLLRPLGNVIVMMPPLSVTIKELDHMCSATYDAIQHITRSTK